MTGPMTQFQFETLSRRLLETLGRVDGRTSFLAVCRLLLDGELALLIRRTGRGVEGGELLEISPQTNSEWATTNLGTLRGWCKAEGPSRSSNAQGYAKEETLVVGGRTFSDALVAFGVTTPRGGGAIYEVLIFRDSNAEGIYSSYHCAIAAALLRQLEVLEAVKERTRSERYARSLSTDVLPFEAWKKMVDRLEAGEATADPDVIGPIVVQWTAHRCRTDRAKDFDAAHRWLQEHNTSDLAGYLKVTGFLVGDDQLDKNLGKTLEDMACRGPEQRKAVVMALEHGWRRAAAAVYDGQASGTEKTDDPACGVLLRLTSVLTADALVTPRPDASIAEDKIGSDLGRDVLRLYFASLLAAAPSLRRRYLWLGEGEKHDRVPPLVRREFLLNLCRYMLGIIAVMECQWGVNSEPVAVSPMERLDSLLYLVDRYVHVELEVEECLSVREHLARGVAAEVQHHLTKPYYRDHLVHVIDVFFVGHLLLHAQIVWIGGKERLLIEHLIRLEPSKPRQTAQGSESIAWHPKTSENCLKQWAVAALLHDIGYQFGRAGQEAEVISAVKVFFSLRGRPRPEWLPDELQEKAGFLDSLKEGLRSKCASEWLPADKSCDPHDHGLLSALRVAQILAHVGAATAATQEEANDGLLREYDHALHAMAHHNLSSHAVRLESHPLSCLLRLCDELQEWSRPRVDIEQVVKQLYLKLEGDDGEFNTFESLAGVEGNVAFSHNDVASAVNLKIKIIGRGPRLAFRLRFRNPVEAHFDTTAAFLSKAFNLQHLDLTQDRKGYDALEWRLELIFPRPVEYRGLSEVDLYGLFSERVRILPSLEVYPALENAKPGLVILGPEGKGEQEDRVAIVVKGAPKEGPRRGWLRFDPATLYQEIIAFKKETLGGRAMTREVEGG